MDSTTNRLTGHEIAQLIAEGRICPFPRPSYQPHDYNAVAVQEVMALSPEQRQAWLAEKRKKRAALQTAMAE
ncbi:MAG: hypothetical protein HC884_00975 [Chloroflexaceae bacterium]|nr:hypothetical protein [Chloroflexaceae bacterium]